MSKDGKSGTMSFFGNLIWIILGGIEFWFAWVITGLLWCVTIVGIPIGKQCFKMAKLTLAPFGKEVVPTKSTTKTLVNIIWLLITGLWYALGYVIIALLYFITIIGIPFGKQYLKMAKLALMPFGAEIVKK